MVYAGGLIFFILASLSVPALAAERCTSKAISEGDAWIYEVHDSKTGFTQSIIGVAHGNERPRTEAANLLATDLSVKQKAEILQAMAKNPKMQEGIESRRAGYAYLAEKAGSLAWIGVEGGTAQVQQYEVLSSQDLKITEFANKYWANDKAMRDKVRAATLFAFSYPFALKSARYPKLQVFGVEGDTHDRIMQAMDSLPAKTSREAIFEKLKHATSFPQLGITEQAIRDLEEIGIRTKAETQTEQDKVRFAEIINGIKNPEVMVLAKSYFFLAQRYPLSEVIQFMSITAGHEMREGEMANSMRSRQGNGAVIIGSGHATRLKERLLAMCNGTPILPPDDLMRSLTQAYTNPGFTFADEVKRPTFEFGSPSPGDSGAVKEEKE